MDESKTVVTEELRPPSILYKYVQPERIDILEFGLIRFTQPAALNDPFELRPIFSDFLSPKELAEIRPSEAKILKAIKEQYENLPSELKQRIPYEEIIEKLKNNPEILRNAADTSDPIKYQAVSSATPVLRAKLKDGLAARFGILSLSESPLDSVLWAHYAMNHRGFVLGFSTTNDYFDRRRSEKDDYYHLRKVNYKDRNPEGRTLKDLTAEDVFLTKKKEWSYEKEWRMVIPLIGADRTITGGEQPIYLYKLETSAICEVILGARIEQAHSEKLLSLIQSKKSLSHMKIKKVTIPEEGTDLRILEL